MNEIFTRTSVRKFLDKKVEQEKIELLMRAAMAAPSAGNQQGWEFLITSDRDKAEQLSNISAYAWPLKNAPLVIAVLGDERRLRSPHHWEQDLGAATQNILLEAVSLGLGAVWIGVAPVRNRMCGVADILNLPAHSRPYALIAIGYPDGEIKLHDRFDPERIHFEKY